MAVTRSASSGSISQGGRRSHHEPVCGPLDKQERMDRLGEKLALWHNRNPLARRVSAFDVHTIGVVALPFMHDRPPREADEPIEPVLTDEVPLSEAQFDDQDEHPVERRTVAARLRDAGAELVAGLRGLTLRLRGRGDDERPRALPLFSERIIHRLPTRSVIRFARRHGYASPPGQPDWPQRVVAIDERLMAKHASRAGGAWPYELYLMSAGIDAGAARTRVLMAEGPGGQLQVLGRRNLSRPRVALAALLPLLAAAAFWLWPSQSGRDPDAEIAAAVAGAASATASASASATASASANPPAGMAPSATSAASAAATTTAASRPALAAASAASAASVAPAASAAASASPFGVPASQLSGNTGGAEELMLPDLRPQIVTLRRPRGEPAPALGAGVAALEAQRAAAAASAASAASAAKAANTGSRPPSGETAGKSAEPPGRPELPTAEATVQRAPMPMPSGKQVALVGQPSAERADAEDRLERMLAAAALLVPDRSRLQSQVFKTHEGWRPAIWPFASREEAQLINATMIARGLHTRAVDF